MKLKAICSLLSLFLLTFSNLVSEIIEAASTKDILNHIQPHTLVIFDIDDTIFIPKQALGSDVWFLYTIDKNKKSGMDKHLAFTSALHLWHKIQHKTEVKPVEEVTPSLINKLQEQQYTVMALTTRGHMIAERTIELLASLNIYMHPTCPYLDSFYLKNVPEVLWKQGVLFSNGEHKGKVLLSFLDEVGYKPQHILFINDKKSNIQEVEESLKEQNIPFIGLRYSASDERVNNFNPEIAEMQLTLFESLLSDEASSLLINNKLGQS